MVYIILGTGFEEAEALIPCDLLRRAGIEVRLAGIGSGCITGGHGIRVSADCTVEEMGTAQAEMIVLPGGLGGVASIRGSAAALAAVRTLYRDGKYVAAICAAPTILAELGITEGRSATCYPGMEQEMGGAKMLPQNVVTDGRIITGRAAGAAFDFALALICALRGQAAAEKTAAGIVYRQED